MLFRATDAFFAINEAFLDDRVFRGRDAVFTPPPVDHAQFASSGPNARAAYGIAPDTRLVTVIGKLSGGRGFEEALHTFAVLRRSTEARLMIIGHGEHRPALEALAQAIGIADHVTWAGYHEEDLAEHYRASDLLLFTARGSDEGHRAVLEAMACGVVPASFPIEGVSSLVGTDLVASQATPESLASLAASLLARDLHPLRRQVAARSLAFGYPDAAARLIHTYRLMPKR